MLPASNRLRSSQDFARTTKIGHRATSPELIFYGSLAPAQNEGAKVGLIISKSVGNSVVRHRIARQLRHNIKEQLSLFPKEAQIVIRFLRAKSDYSSLVIELAAKLSQRLSQKSTNSTPPGSGGK